MAMEKVGLNILFTAVLVAGLAATIPMAFASHVDVITSQGADTIGSKIANTAGLTGKGVKIAIIDGGFDLNNSEIAGHVDIAGSMSFIRGTCGNDLTNCDNQDDVEHGTAVAEIVADIAPEARLYLYNFNDHQAEFPLLVDYLINRGDIDIITMSQGWFNDVGPVDGTSDVSKKVTEARKRGGILWINAVGNYAQQHWQGQFSDPDGDDLHNFRGDVQRMPINVYAGKNLDLYLSWDDNWKSPSHDYDLYLVDRQGKQLVNSTDYQGIPKIKPVEVLSYTPETNSTVYVEIRKHSSTRNVNFQLFIDPSPYKLDKAYQVARSSIALPEDAHGAFAVGATHWDTDRLEPYSSQGPTLDGRTKPDITAPSAVRTTAYSPEIFPGTSAAAPHVAGAAALVMQKYPDATADQVQKILESTVASRQAKSNDYGTGRLDVRMLANADIDILALENSNRSCASDKTCFYPEILRISRGDTVTWVNTERSAITITGSTGSDSFASGQIPYRGSYNQTFTSDGTFSYSDGLHPWATGYIVVGTGAALPPTFSSASVTGPNQVTMLFDKPVTASQNAFTTIELIGAPLNTSTRQATLVAGSGTQTITITFDGQPVPTDATAIIRFINNRITDQQGNALAGAGFATATDGQRPMLNSIAITGPNTITAEFTEKVKQGIRDGGVADGFIGFRIGENDRRNTTITSGSAATNPIILSFGGAPADLNASGTITITDDIQDVQGNKFVQLINHPVRAGQVPVTDTTISGRVCVTFADDGVCNTGDPGYVSNPPYTMYLVPPANSGLLFDGRPYRTAQVNQDTGTYVFENVTPNIQWVVQTLYFPRDLTVKDDATSWYTRVTPTEGQAVKFDVAFYRVPQSERNTLELRTYNDINQNRIRDADEVGIPNLTFRAYTYLSASYEDVVTGANGSVTKSDMMRGDWAVLTPEGWIITSIVYERTDLTSGKQYREDYPVVDNPESGSVHTMTFGMYRP